MTTLRIGLFPYLIAGKWPEDIWNTYAYHADAAGVEFIPNARTGIDAILADFREVEPWMLEQTAIPVMIEQGQGGPNFGGKMPERLLYPHISAIHHCVWRSRIPHNTSVGIGFGALTRLEPLRRADIDGYRSVDVSFVGTTTFGKKATNDHRQAMLKATASLSRHTTEIIGRDKMGGEELPLSVNGYFESLLRAKIAISPYGLGDCCHRDFEAILAGCVMVGPDRDDIEAWPDIYRSGEMYERCANDYSDLVDVVDRILSNWQRYNEWRRGNRMWLIEETQPWRVARRIRRTFERCMT